MFSNILKLSLPLMCSAFALVSCGGGKPSTASSNVPVVADWKTVVMTADRERIHQWRTAFVKALDEARAHGNGLSIDREGVLLDPDAALGGPAPSPGKYQCRVVKLGANGAHMSSYVVYPDYRCVIAAEGDVMSFSKSGGPQRPVGLIFKGDDRRRIFLGTMVLGDETRAIEYGRDSTRDMAGAVERIGDNRWRMILPYPRFESVMDVIELVPVS